MKKINKNLRSGNYKNLKQIQRNKIKFQISIMKSMKLLKKKS